MDEQKCKVCGCAQNNACVTDRGPSCVTDRGPCWWITKDLCSACVGKKNFK